MKVHGLEVDITPTTINSLFWDEQIKTAGVYPQKVTKKAANSSGWLLLYVESASFRTMREDIFPGRTCPLEPKCGLILFVPDSCIQKW